MSFVDANLQFNIPKLFQLHKYGIKLIEELSKDRFRFYATTGEQLLKGDRQRAPSLSAKYYVELIFRAWLTSKRPTYPPTWESFFTVLRNMDLGHLAEQIGKYVTGSLPAIESSPQSSEPLVEKEGESQVIVAAVCNGCSRTDQLNLYLHLHLYLYLCLTAFSFLPVGHSN